MRKKQQTTEHEDSHDHLSYQSSGENVLGYSRNPCSLNRERDAA